MAGGDLTAYIDFDTTGAKQGLDEVQAKSRRTSVTIEKEWSKAGDSIVKMFGPGNLARAAFAGIGAAVGIATMGLREYAKVSDDAAASMDRMARSRSRFFREVGADLYEMGAGTSAEDPWQFLSDARDTTGVLWSWLNTPVPEMSNGQSYREQRDTLQRTRDFDEARVMRRQYIERAANAGLESRMLATGDSYEKQELAVQHELRRIAMERSEISADDLLYGEKVRALQTEELAAADRLAAIDRDRRENAEQRAEALTRAAAAVAKEQLAAMMAGERSKDSFAFQERDLRLDMMRAAGADGVDAAAINLQFDRLKYGVASDTSISPEERDSRRARLDELRAERLALLGMESPEEAVRMRSFARPGAISSGFAGVTSIYRQAFAPPGATSSDPVTQIRTDVQQIRKELQRGQVARLG